MYRVARSLLSQEQDAEDLTHDVFVRLQKGGFDSKRRAIRPYLLLLTRSMGLNRLKKKHNRHRILQVFRPVQPHIESVDLEAMDAQIKLEQALAELASQEQRILIMSYREDMSQSRIAANCSFH